MAAYDKENKAKSNVWKLDSGASVHVCKNSEMLNPVEKTKALVNLADGTELAITAKGDASIGNGRLVLKNVYYIPESHHNLLSVSQICMNGYIVEFDKEHCRILSPDKKLLVRGRCEGYFFHIDLDEALPSKQIYSSSQQNYRGGNQNNNVWNCGKQQFPHAQPQPTTNTPQNLDATLQLQSLRQVQYMQAMSLQQFSYLLPLAYYIFLEPMRNIFDQQPIMAPTGMQVPVKHTPSYLALPDANNGAIIDRWIIDSGAKRHACNNLKMLDPYEMVQGSSFIVPNGTKVAIEAVGQASISGQGGSLVLDHVRYVSGFRANLLSVGQICQKGYTVQFDRDQCRILGPDRDLVVSGCREAGLYYTQQN